MRSFVLPETSLSDFKRGITLPKNLTEDLAELCGIHIGDGYLGYRENVRDYRIQCFGYTIDDKEHYDLYIKQLWKKLFNVDLRLFSRKDNTYGFYIYSKSILFFFHNILEMPMGAKSKIIKIPNLIKETCTRGISKEMIACLRGIIDTDFYLVLNKGYPELGAWFASRDLVLDLFYYLKLLGLSPTIRLGVSYYNSSARKVLVRHQIRIRKSRDINFWFWAIETHNQKFYKRYYCFQRVLGTTIMPQSINAWQM